MPHDACIDHRAAFSFCFTLSRILMVNGHHFVTMYYFHPFRLAKSSIAAQNLSHGANVICDGSPSRMRRVRRISLGITTRPSSSMRLTMPVALTFAAPPCLVSAIGFPWKGDLCAGRGGEELANAGGNHRSFYFSGSKNHVSDTRHAGCWDLPGMARLRK